MPKQGNEEEPAGQRVQVEVPDCEYDPAVHVLQVLAPVEET